MLNNNDVVEYVCHVLKVKDVEIVTTAYAPLSDKVYLTHNPCRLYISYQNYDQLIEQTKNYMINKKFNSIIENIIHET